MVHFMLDLWLGHVTEMELKMTQDPKNAVTWFSIPATDFEKSIAFYQGLLGIKLSRETMGEGNMQMPFAMFPKQNEDGVTGAVTPANNVQPASGGVVIYLACSDLDGALGRVEGLGGSVVMPKMALPNEVGDIAIISDIDGTPVGLHQG